MKDTAPAPILKKVVPIPFYCIRPIFNLFTFLLPVLVWQRRNDLGPFITFHALYVKTICFVACAIKFLCTFCSILAASPWRLGCSWPLTSFEWDTFDIRWKIDLYGLQLFGLGVRSALSIGFIIILVGQYRGCTNRENFITNFLWEAHDRFIP